MPSHRLIAIAGVFIIAAVAWGILGRTLTQRTEELDDRLSEEMHSLWGPKTLVQTAPYVAPNKTAKRNDAQTAPPQTSEIRANVAHTHRNKGLLWYSTFTVRFEGRYTVAPPEDSNSRCFIFQLPKGVTGYDGLEVEINGDPFEVTQTAVASAQISASLPSQEQNEITVRYTTRGQDIWLYTHGDPPTSNTKEADVKDKVLLSQGPLSRISDFSLTITTDFADIDYPKGTAAPNEPAENVGAGMRAVWKYDNALTNKPMGIVTPRRVNAGPIAARMSFFAPVSLFFFFTVLFAVVVLKRIPLHPMHYLFIAAGFFAFHILMAYLVDHVNVHLSFWICAAVSVLLVVSYMRLVAGVRFAVVYVGMAQLVYLVGFAYAFFWVGMTGLTITIGAIITLFLLMQATGRVNWDEAFETQALSFPPPPPMSVQSPPRER